MQTRDVVAEQSDEWMNLLQVSAAGLFKYVWPFLLPPGIKGLILNIK